MFYLYVKTHNQTGLKYLGKTSKNPFTYKGSGIYWKKHLLKHGNDVTTEILVECENDYEIKKWGLYYSNLWDIVNVRNENGRKIWANQKSEIGDGTPSGKYHHLSRKNPDYDCTKHPNFGKKHKTPTIEKNRFSNSGINSNQYGSKWINNGLINKKIKNDSLPYGWSYGKITEFGKRDKTNKKNPNYDFTLREFIHKNGTIEKCTQQELIAKYNLRASSISSLIHGKLKSTAGWRLKNVE